MRYETAGDPISGLKWTKRTTEKIARELRSLGLDVCANTVARLLKQMGFSLRVNHKKLSQGSEEARAEQFSYIAELRERFAREGNPVVSVDTKKKEMVGNFKNPGSAWQQKPVLVNDHDFRSTATGMAIPYGVYDVQANRGCVFVGMSHDTPEFATTSLKKWWIYDGQYRYPQARKLLILADCGGSNGPRYRAWKYGIHEKLCKQYGLCVTVSHYPPTSSKWNPIEHRLFSEISKNWAGRPLDSYETVLNYIQSTTTSTGLQVKSYIDRSEYLKGVTITKQQMELLHITKHETLSKWNYTLSAR